MSNVLEQANIQMASIADMAAAVLLCGNTTADNAQPAAGFDLFYFG